MKIIAVRHGETEDNRRGILRGRPEQGLNSNGKNQAHSVALKLKNEHIDKIYASDFQRCVETMETIKTYHIHVPSVLAPQLRELGGGKGRLPLWLPPPFVEPILGMVLRLNISTPGGDSWKNLKARIKDFLNELYSLHPDATVLFVTHGITIQAIKELLVTNTNKKSLGKTLPNGSIIRLTMNDLIAD